MSDCRDCIHNGYRNTPAIKGWIYCEHPVTRAKTPKWEPGDPEMVAYRTGDVPVSELHNIQDCPAYEQGGASEGLPGGRNRPEHK